MSLTASQPTSRTYIKHASCSGPSSNSFVIQRRVLILCHPRLVTGTFEPLVLNDHWWGSDENGNPYMESLIPHGMTGDPTFDTVDIKKGGTFTADAFSDSFNDQHIEEYDLIIAPDCGGVWYTHQESSDDNDKDELIFLCLGLTRMLKPGGLVQFGKFFDGQCLINGMEFPSFKDGLHHCLEQIGFTVTFTVVCDFLRVLAARKPG
jgi:hypothetical protein